MILKSIIINGFKSFGKKTVIDISKNVTGIVGPNGSGKSNIVEAIRFVIGEQSMKNMRSKSLADLIHLGEDKLNRASVSLIIENDSKRFQDLSDSISPELIDFLKVDEITLTREIFIDGESNYKINNTIVRLKDIQAILSMVGIGASAHTIISQGEADNILSASPKDRKEIISEALGLRILENRLRESKRKLDKTLIHISEVNLSRKEIHPEIKELKSIVDKINNLSVIRENITEEYIKYLVVHTYKIKEISETINNHSGLSDILSEKKGKLSALKLDIKDLDSKQIEHRQDIDNKKSLKQNELLQLEKEKSVLIYEKNILLQSLANEIQEMKVNKNEFINFKSELKNKLIIISNNIKNKNLDNINQEINICFDLIKSTDNWHDAILPKDKINKDIQDLDDRINELENKSNIIKKEIIEIDNLNDNRFITLRNMLSEEKSLELDINSINNQILENENRKSRLIEMENNNNLYLAEANNIIGQAVLRYKSINPLDIIDNYNEYENKRNIDKYKWKIEELGVINTRDIMDRYNVLIEKDKYLQSEIDDLESSRNKLYQLISELELRLENDFVKGLEKLNFLFNNYFHEIFSGGSAKLNTIIIDNNTDANNDNEDSETKREKIGIDININLPQKKVKSLTALSGGEKTLVSISILFALTTITPPPFMVLDETDAALDETNAKKYGKLLNRLAEKSRLLVITHNRETMNKCDILYGVTMGQDSSSRILSIKFE